MANRRAFAEEAAELWARRTASSSDSVAVVAMIDIDEFKAVNDRFGHATGDLALTTLAGNLSAAVGASATAAVVGRLGGDEFAVVALAPDAAAAERVGQALVAASDLHTACPGVTATVGWVAVGPSVGAPDSLDEAIARADHALYSRKQPSTRTLTARG